MSTEIVLLIVIVLIASGVWFSRRNWSSRFDNNSTELSLQYFQGLNYVLNEQPDKAIEVFIKMLDVDSETVETHFALGNLFRRRGEVDRAIRIHQNLIARATLSSQERVQALYELGLDYMGAGILGRAETLFLELVDDECKNVPALQHLLDIYQQEKDWEKAIATIKKYEHISGNNQNSVIAQYYCELAEIALATESTECAKKHISTALKCDKNCVRASILEGNIKVKSNDFTGAIQSYKRILEQNSEYLPEIIEPILKMHSEISIRAEIRKYLEEILEVNGGVLPMLALTKLIQEQFGDKQAINFISEQLTKHPSVRGLNCLIELCLANNQGIDRSRLQLFYDLTSKLIEEKTIYKCQQCGFSGKSMHWQCPGCKHWASIKSVQGVESEFH